MSNSIGESNWEGNGNSAGQELSRLLWNPRFITMFTTVRQLTISNSQISPFHTLIFCFLHSVVCCNPLQCLGLLSDLAPFLLFLLGLNSVCISYFLHAYYIPRQFSLLDLKSLLIFGERNKIWSSSVSNFFHLAITFSVFVSNIIYFSAISSQTSPLHFLTIGELEIESNFEKVCTSKTNKMSKFRSS
jgi:hypothetical protein